MAATNIIDELFGETARPQTSEKFRRFGLTRNPFPGNEEEFFGFVQGQDDAKDLFKQRFTQFCSDFVVASLLVVADHRVGKTNFLRYYSNRLLASYEASTESSENPKLLPFYTNVYEYDFFFVYRQIVERLPQSLVLDCIVKIKNSGIPSHIPETDLVRALKTLAQKYNNGNQEDEKRIDLFIRWLKGGYRSLDRMNREELGVQENITNTPVGSRFLRDFLSILRTQNTLHGIILFFDEFERLLGAGISRAQKDRYLNDFRNFISDFQNGAFFCFAITPAALAELQRVYPAIPPRLGTQLRLLPIRSEVEAVEFAKQYIDHFREEANLNIHQPADLITKESIQNVFLRSAARFQSRLPQGIFLQMLREEVEKNIGIT